MLEYIIFTGLVIIITALMIRQNNKKLTKPIKEETNSKHTNKPMKLSESLAAGYKNYLDIQNNNKMEAMLVYTAKQLDVIRESSVGIEPLENMIALVSHSFVDAKKISNKHTQNL